MKAIRRSVLNSKSAARLLTQKPATRPLKNTRFFYFPVLFLMIIYASPHIRAGQTTGLIRGTIYNSASGSAVQGAAVFLEPGNRFTETDDRGHFQFDRLPPGRYHLLIQRIGYLPERRQSLDIGASRSIEITIRLEERILQAADSVSVTARRNRFTTMMLPTSRDLVNEQQLQQQRPFSLAEALKTVQGSFIKDYGSFGSLKTISLRGSSAEQVVVMLDGQKLNDPQTGQVDLSLLNVDGIQSVEILRGGSSALYGADAVGGVINILSKQPEKAEGLHALLDLTGGSFHTTSLKSELGLKRDWFSGTFGFRRLISRGDFVYESLDGQEEKQKNNDFSSSNLYTNLDFELGDTAFPLSLNLVYRYYDTRRGVPGTTEMPLPSTRQWDSDRQIQAVLQGKILNALNHFSIRTGSLHHQFRYESNDGLVPVDSRFSSGNNGMEISMETIFSAYHALSYGVGIRNDWLQNHTFSDHYRRYNTFAYLQDESTLPFNLFHTSMTAVLIPALRLDHFSDSGITWSPKFGGSVSSGKQWQTMLRLNLGWSYRMPTFNELYWPADPWSKGNASLQPEKGFDWDLGLNLRYPILAGLTFDISYFAVHMNNLILWQPSGQIWQPENISRSRSKGIEISASLQLLKQLAIISGNYTYLDATNESDVAALKGKYLIYRPRHTLNFSIQIEWRYLQVSLDHSLVGKRYANAANTISVDAYHRTDLAFRWQFTSEKWQPSCMIQIKNLFNETYQVIRYQPMPGREIRLGMSIAYR